MERHLGWIRFNCNLDNTGFTGMSNECDTNDYGVFNDLGQLTGKALIESSGQYIYFDEQSYLDDFGGDPAIIQILMPIFPVTLTHKDIFWDEHGHQILGGLSMDGKKFWRVVAQKRMRKMSFSITEWSCVTEGPQPIEKNKFYVFCDRR